MLGAHKKTPDTPPCIRGLYGAAALRPLPQVLVLQHA